MLRHSHPIPPLNPNYATPVFTSTKRKRAANACRRCRTRKQRCDGLSIPCKNCSKAGAECTFPEDASGEHLLREHIAMLESRIGDLTAALQTVTSHSPSLRNDSQSHKQSGETTSLSSFEYPPVDPISKSIISELEPGSMDQSRPKRDESVQEDDLVNGIGFLSLTSGAEPLYVGGSSGASWGRIFSSVLRRSTGRSKLSSRSLIPPQSLPAPVAPIERPTSQSRSSSSSFTSTSSSRSRFSSSPTRIPLHIRPKFVFPLLPTSKAVSNDILVTVYSIIQSRYSFMNFTALEIWHDQREALCGPQEVQGNGERTAAFFLWLTYALGVRVWEGRGKTAEGLASHEHYFQAALQYFDHVQSNITTIQALLFLAMYSFRSEKGLSAWHLSGLAMRTAVELGLHRKTPENKLLDPFMEETRKRVWWSVYCLERTMALQLGRPIAIQDTDIDIELPLDIDCRVTNGDQIRERALAISKALAESNTTLETNPYPLGITSMSSSLHHIRLRKLLTKVKETVYHHQREKSGPHAEDVRRRENLDRLSKELDTWRRTSPRWVNTDAEYGSARATEAFRASPPPDDFSRKESSGFDEGIRGDGRTPAYVYEWFDLQWAIQLLLIPYALTASPGDPYLHQAVIAAMHSCELQKKRVEKGSLAPLSIYTLHKVFMAGIFLLWALDKDPDVFLMLQSYPESHLFFPKPNDHHPISKPTQVSESCPDRHADPIASCSQVLSVYAEHYPEVKAYAECFDQLVIDRKAIWNKYNSCGTSPLNTQDSRGYPGPVAPEFPDKLSYRGDPLMHDMALRQPAFMAPTPMDVFLQGPNYSTRGGQEIDGFNLNLTRILEQSHGLEAIRPGAVKSFESFKLDLSDPLIANIGNYGELDLVQYERPLDHRAMAPALSPREDFFSCSGLQPPQSFYCSQTTPMNAPKDRREMYTDYDFNPLQLDGPNSQANDQERPHFSIVWPTSTPHEQVLPSQNIEMQASTHQTDGESLHCQFSSSDAAGNMTGSVSQPYQFDSSLRDSTSSSLELDRTEISNFPYTSTSTGQYENVNYQYPVSWEHHVHGISMDQKNATPPNFPSTSPTMNPSRTEFSPPGCSTLGNAYQGTKSHSDPDRPTNNCHPSTSSNYVLQPPNSSSTNGSIEEERTKVRRIIIEEHDNHHHSNSEVGVRQEGYNEMIERSDSVPLPDATHTNALSMPLNTVFTVNQSSLHPFLGGMGDSQFWAALQAVAAGVNNNNNNNNNNDHQHHQHHQHQHQHHQHQEKEEDDHDHDLVDQRS
ncbi:hypothetical protein CROQUDRAFT_667781 [Cronartium quercuum f. sp. fusiforme G11]|uniref:Zn(2)-C6 fungal-type domain-containing protein n=1 Tax=Cronartium quercuum f. sp. fusiforme G11 TaxID=708437 RepID=A0A9P6NWT4_9BASI|nr:hypothetical protein CROQUDRAFT_667781 [Cronartium quercuum f. sp. fusiforme G11]